MVRIAILDDFQDVARQMGPWDQLLGDCFLQVFHDHLADEESIAERLQAFDVVVIMRERTPFPRTLIERLPNLRLLVTSGWRNLAVDLVACRERSIVVCGTDAGSAPTAELAWGLILALSRNIPREDRAIREGGWQTSLGTSLKGKVLGIVGLGRLGAEMARIGLAFGMEIIAWSQNLSAIRAAEVGAHRVGKTALFATADVISLHVVLSDRTRGLVGARELASMKQSAFLVNTSRGPVVDEGALIEALSKGRIAGAGLDVYGQEPLPSGHPLRALENTVLTPHHGYVTRESYATYFTQAVENILAWLNSDPIRLLEPPK